MESKIQQSFNKGQGLAYTYIGENDFMNRSVFQLNVSNIFQEFRNLFYKICRLFLEHLINAILCLDIFFRGAANWQRVKGDVEMADFALRVQKGGKNSYRISSTWQTVVQAHPQRAEKGAVLADMELGDLDLLFRWPYFDQATARQVQHQDWSNVLEP